MLLMSKQFLAHGIVRLSFSCIVAALVTGCSGGGGQMSSLPQSGNGVQSTAPDMTSPAYVQRQIATGQFIPACPDAVSNGKHCLALGIRDRGAVAMSENDGFGAVQGWGPSQLQTAYNITSIAKLKKSKGLVAVIEFGGDPNIVSDLAMYRKQFGLAACGKKNNCIRVVNQSGQPSPLPAVNDGWLAEQSLDVDMVSANCPHCHILVVEASSNLETAAQVAQSFHPVAISNSWGGGEFNGEQNDENSFFSDPGVAITASAGDGGYGVIFPSAANTVSAIGGTSLRQASGPRGYSETVWSGSGSGCSQFIPETSWQQPIESKLGGCSNRFVSDVAYEADPNTGVAVYESIAGDGESPGWQVWGGTSVGSPAIAAIYALSKNTTGVPASIAYGNPLALYDVTSGSNGSCSPAYLCTGEVGYDGPTGLGTPNGVGAF
jgi:subtilase family serine protease